MTVETINENYTVEGILYIRDPYSDYKYFYRVGDYIIFMGIYGKAYSFRIDPKMSFSIFISRDSSLKSKASYIDIVFLNPTPMAKAIYE